MASTAEHLVADPEVDALRRAPEIVVDAVEQWIPGSTARPNGTDARGPQR